MDNLAGPKQLRDFESAAPIQLFGQFVETSGAIVVEKDQIFVHYDERSHNLILWALRPLLHNGSALT